jgi:hypothetical protein
MSLLSQILQDMLSWDLIASLASLFDLLRRLAAWVGAHRLQGIYDVLDQRRTVTIHDASGRIASVDTLQRVRFRQNHVTAITEYAWGEGELFADYCCTPGVPVDRYAEGSRQVILISLREHKNAGDDLCLRSHRRILEGFIRPEEYWESDVCHRTHRIEVRIIFPTERKCQRATVTVRSTGKTVALGPECYHILPDGRQALCWTNIRPRLNERYLLRWVW